MTTLFLDLRYAIRGLRARPGVTAVAVATIALAIGANAAIFSFVDGLLLNPLPYPDSERIVRVLERRPDGGVNGVSSLNYLDWAAENTVFEHIAAQSGWSTTMTGGDEPVRMQGMQVSPAFFSIYGLGASLGRTFAPDEDQVGNDAVVVLGHSLWQSRFGGDETLVGSDIVLDGRPYTVVGVLPEGSMFDRMAPQIVKPMVFEPANMTRDFHWFGALAKLAPGVSLEQARAEMDLIGRRIAETYPDIKRGWSVAVDPLGDVIVGDNMRASVLLMFAATGLVLLIGCANLASLALARGLSREQEIAVRASLGAGRWRLARLALTENVAIAVLGGILGIGVATVMMLWLRSLIPPFMLPAEAEIGIDSSVVVFALGVAVLTGLLFGLAPAIQAGGTRLVGAIKDGGRGTTAGSAGRRLRSGLVVAEVALAFVLLVGAGLMMRSLLGLLDSDPGFESGNVLTARLPIAQASFDDPAELNAYLDSLQAGVAAVPGVRETAITSALPLRGWGYGMPYLVEGRERPEPGDQGGGFFKMVTPSYFSTLGLDVVEGRALADTDRVGAPPVAVVNETLARREFPDGSAIGQRLLVQQIVPGRQQLGEEIAWEIVGVVADEKIGSLRDVESGGLYVTTAQSPVYGVSLLVRADIDAAGLERSVRAAVSRVNANQALSDVETLDQIVAQSVRTERIQSILLATFAATALLLAGIGIYGVISYSVAQRTHELGIRATLGATADHLRLLVFRNGMRLALAGLALGLIGSFAAGKLMSSWLFGVGAIDPVTTGVVALVLLAVAGLACLIPAHRATRIDPNEALRTS